jgi:soluble lytic murein transglycosylase-like protein
MTFVDPIQQPRQYVRQVDALFRESFIHPDGPDPTAIVEAQLQTSFEQLVASHMAPTPMPPAAQPDTADVASDASPIASERAPTSASVVPVVGSLPAPVSKAPASHLDAMIGEISGRYGVPSWLVKNVVSAESNGNPAATSGVGAMGLMQLMPETAVDLGVDDPYNPRENIEGGTKYLKQLLDRFGGPGLWSSMAGCRLIKKLKIT